MDLSEQAFELDPALATDTTLKHRYNAACAAALAGCGQGKDAGNLTGDDRAYLREQAVNWLQADLEIYGEWMQSGKDRASQAVKRLEHWLQDRDLAGVRDLERLAELPEDEAEVWRDLWDEVKLLLAQAR